MVINEINYNSSDSFNPDDWVELYNNSNDTIDITSWLLKDEKDDHIFIIPSNTILLPDQYIILCKDTIKFIDAFPDVLFKYGDFGFGLGGGSDAIRLFDANGTLADFVEYDDDLPWPLSADGEGPTLELKNPSLDNLLPENWMASSVNTELLSASITATGGKFVTEKECVTELDSPSGSSTVRVTL